MHQQVITPDVMPLHTYEQPTGCTYVEGVRVLYSGFWFWKKEIKRERVVIVYRYYLLVGGCKNKWLPAYHYHYYPHATDTNIGQRNEKSSISHS